MARATDRSPVAFFGLDASRASQVPRPFISLPSTATCTPRSCWWPRAPRSTSRTKKARGLGPLGVGVAAMARRLGARVAGTKSGGKMVQLCFLSWISRWKKPFGKCPSPPSCSGMTPLDLARQFKEQEVVKLLESAVSWTASKVREGCTKLCGFSCVCA